MTIRKYSRLLIHRCFMFFRYIFNALFLGLILFATSCNSEGNKLSDHPSSEMESIKKDLDTYNTSINELNSEIAVLKKNISSLLTSSVNHTRCLGELGGNKDVLHPKEQKGFKILNTKLGAVIIYVLDVSEYLGGYKVYLKLGNTTNTSFINPVLNLRWSYDPLYYIHNVYEKKEELRIATQKYDEIVQKTYRECIRENKEFIRPDFQEDREAWSCWEKSFKQKQIDVLKTLSPGSWTTVEITLFPSSLCEMEWMEFSIDILTVSLSD